MLRVCMIGVAALALAAFAVPQAQAQKKQIKIANQLRGSVGDADLAKGAPECITSAQTLEQLWKRWNLEGKAPKVDFTKDVVVLATTSGSRINLFATLDDNG